jgi:hypothetical protein
MVNDWLLQQARMAADAQSEILKIMTVFPAYYAYKSHPTYDQFVPFVREAVEQGYCLTSLYPIFASWMIPPDLDALARKHAQGWRPAGEIVESTAPLGSYMYRLQRLAAKSGSNATPESIEETIMQAAAVIRTDKLVILPALEQACGIMQQFEASVTQLQTQAGESQAELDTISTGILRLAEGRDE